MEKKKNVKSADKNPPIKKEESSKPEPRFSSAMESFVERFASCDVNRVKSYLKDAEDQFRLMSDRDLTLSQRRSKVGAGIRNYGFIVKAAELVAENPQFALLFNAEILNNCIYNFDESRNINVTLQSMVRQTSNSMLTYSDEAYSLSLIFYNSVKELARRGNPDAITLYRQLQPFFRRRNPEHGSKPPTEHETLRDAKALLHGHKDGKIVIENERPHLSEGKRIIVDETHRDKANLKETIEE